MKVQELIAALAMAWPEDEVEIHDVISQYSGDVQGIQRHPAQMAVPGTVVLVTRLDGAR